MARHRDRECFRGEDVELDVTVYVDDDSSVTDDITGWAISFELMTANNGTPILTASVGDGITLDDPANGGLTISLSGDDLDRTPRGYYYTISRTDVGSRRLLAYGIFRIKPPTVAGMG